MIGKHFTAVFNHLIRGQWRVSDSEENWVRLYKYDIQADFTRVLELSYYDGIITGIFSYNY